MTVARIEGNVSEDNQARRMRVGVYIFTFALLLGTVLVKLDAPPVYRALVMIPFWIAAQGFFTALYKTCGFMAAKGLRQCHCEDGVEKIVDRAELKRIRTMGLAMLGSALLATGLLTLPFVVF